MPRSVYVISDLHLGGRGPNRPGERGFQMMSHPDALVAFVDRVGADPDSELVINGDFVDFLAEEHPAGPRWRAFTVDPDEAAGAFEAIADRVGAVFAALGRFGRVHPLTVLLGNHDLELCLPGVCRLFEGRCGLAIHQWRFHADNEALVVGTALVEHGNRYDPANVVDHDGLRRVRSLHSRRQYSEAEQAGFVPPSGSELVATVMNPIKEEYPFIDLLKPESEPLFALLLALDPDCRRHLARLAWAIKRIPSRAVLASADRPAFRQEVASFEEEREEDALEAVLSAAVRSAALPDFEEQALARADISSAGARAVLEGLLLGRHLGWDRRVRRIQAALEALRADETFSLEVETGRRYLDAATALSNGGLRFGHVVFGHTHHAKDHPLAGGGRYLNSGTWADLMRFPDAALDPHVETARAALETFLLDCGSGALDRYVEFRPGCAHLVVDGTTTGRYRSYDAVADRLE